MKNLIISLLVTITAAGCNRLDTKEKAIKQAHIIEMVIWKSKEGVGLQEAKESITQLNSFVKNQPGFISRKTALAANGQFVDIVLWTTLKAAKTASEKAMQNENVVKLFSTIDEKEMTFQHFEIFNSIDY